jgi:ribosome maturation factor RimP
MDLTAAIREKIGDFLKPGQFLVEVIFKSKNPHAQKLLVIVDGDQGISIDDCAEVSRALSDWLDAQPDLNTPFTLEVSTPGLDQPLKLERQYRKNIGRQVKVQTKGGSVQTGRLMEVEINGVTLEVMPKGAKKGEMISVNVAFTDIEKTFVVVSFK